MSDKRTFLAGLAAGAVGGLLAGQQLKGRQRRMPYLEFGQQLLAETQGQVKAAVLAARVQSRYDELHARRPRFRHPALRQHLDEGILPALAFYQTFVEQGQDREAALAEIDRILTTVVERSGRYRLVRAMRFWPAPFAILRIANRWALKRVYPPEGWRFEWVEDSDECIAYNARECFYLDLLTAYGAPELTAHLCSVDDVLFRDLPGISWERTKTLGRGDDCCNFRFCRIGPS